MKKNKIKEKTTNVSKYYHTYMAYPVKGYKTKTGWVGTDLSEKEANEVMKTMTIEINGEIIPVRIEEECLTIHTEKTIYEKEK